MHLEFQSNGNLLKGIHYLSFDEFRKYFGFNNYRKQLIDGLKIGLLELKECDCETVYIDGSFVTTKEFPGDFDACWDDSGVNLIKIKNEYQTLIDFRDERKYQKFKYKGEFFPMRARASPSDIYFTFFQKDKDNNEKGMVQLNLKELK